MAKIQMAQIEAAYRLSKDVAAGRIKESEATRTLVEQYAMNQSSAGAYVRKLA
jgi:hypothetical protein